MPTRTVGILLALFMISWAVHAGEITLIGAVIGPREKPIANASIAVERPLSAFEEAMAQLEERRPDPVAIARSDARGHFRVAVPRPGLWWVVIRAPGFTPRDLGAVPLLQSTELKIVRAWPERLTRVRVVGDEGRPVAGARLVADHPGRTLAKTGPDGMASIPIWPINDEISVLADGYLEGAFRNLNESMLTVHLAHGCRRALRIADAQGRPAAGIVVRSGRQALGITDAAGRTEISAPCDAERALHLLTPDGEQIRERLRPVRDGEPARARFRLPPPAARLKGRILEAGSGTPLAGALVWTSDAPAGFTRSDEQGWFSVRKPASPGAQLMATADGVVFARDDLVAFGPQEPLMLHLRPAAAIAATVTDEAGHPVAGAEVTVAGGFWPPESGATTDAKGAFRLRLPAEKPYDLTVFHRDFLPVTSALAVFKPREERRMKIVLQRARSATALVVDGDGRPVAGAKGFLSPPEGCLYDLESSYDRLGCPRQILADAGGRLRFDTLRPGKYQLRVQAPGFTPLSVPGVEVRDSGEITRFGTLRLSPGAAVEGRVIDPQGRPVQGASVSYSDQDTTSQTGVETGEDGRFVIADFRPGARVSLWAAKPGFETVHFEGIEAPTTEPVILALRSQPAFRISCAVRDETGEPVARARLTFLTQDMKRMPSSHALDIPAQADGEGRYETVIGPGIVTLQVTANGYLPREIDFEVPEGEGARALEVVLRSAPATIVGQITGPDGEPVAGVSLSIYAQKPVGRGLSPGPGVVPQTDDNGRFHIEGLTEGAWTVYVDPRGYQRERREVQVRAGENRLDIRLGLGVEVEGQVVDPDGQPVPRAYVSLEPKEPSRLGRPLGGASDATGHFLIARAEPGLYTPQAQAQGFRSSSSTEVAVAGHSVHDLRIVLEREDSSHGRGTLRGRILGLDAKQLAEVKAVDAFQRMGSTLRAPVDAQGEYHLESLNPGEWTVSARTANRRVDARVDLAEGSEARLDVEFPPGITISGRVLRQGEPVAEARVRTLAGPLYFTEVVCNQRGEFRLENIDPGSYRIGIVSRDGRLLHAQPIDLSGDRWVEIELPVNRLSGRVVTADSSPVAWADVVLKTFSYGAGRSEAAHTRTGADGSFTFQNVAAESYAVAVTRDGYEPAETTVQVADGAAADVRVVLRPAGK